MKKTLLALSLSTLCLGAQAELKMSPKKQADVAESRLQSFIKDYNKRLEKSEDNGIALRMKLDNYKTSNDTQANADLILNFKNKEGKEESVTSQTTITYTPELLKDDKIAQASFAYPEQLNLFDFAWFNALNDLQSQQTVEAFLKSAKHSLVLRDKNIIEYVLELPADEEFKGSNNHLSFNQKDIDDRLFDFNGKFNYLGLEESSGFKVTPYTIEYSLKDERFTAKSTPIFVTNNEISMRIEAIEAKTSKLEWDKHIKDYLYNFEAVAKNIQMVEKSGMTDMGNFAIKGETKKVKRGLYDANVSFTFTAAQGLNKAVSKELAPLGVLGLPNIWNIDVAFNNISSESYELLQNSFKNQQENATTGSKIIELFKKDGTLMNLNLMAKDGEKDAAKIIWSLGLNKDCKLNAEQIGKAFSDGDLTLLAQNMDFKLEISVSKDALAKLPILAMILASEQQYIQDSDKEMKVLIQTKDGKLLLNDKPFPQDLLQLMGAK